MSTRSVSFETTLRSFGNNTGIEVPPEAIDQLASGKSPAVVVTVNGYEYRNTVGVRSGIFLISLSAAQRKATGLEGGDPIAVTITLAEGPRPVDMSEDFGSALDANPEARAYFDGLSNSVQRYHCDNINGAKTDETRHGASPRPLICSWPASHDKPRPKLWSASPNGRRRVPATPPGRRFRDRQKPSRSC